MWEIVFYITLLYSHSGGGMAVKKAGKTKPKIYKEMTLGELVEKYPEAARVLVNIGMHCVGCHMAAWETIEEGAKSHGMSDKDINKMIGEMNKIAAGKKKK
jgi:hybrid cluster-associated redox disulfide protein